MASIALLVLTIFAFVLVESRKYNATEVYENYMQDEDKTYFLRYYLGKGYVESGARQLIRPSIHHHKINVPRDLNIPDSSVQRIEKYKIADPVDFPLHLYQKFVLKYNLTSNQALEIVLGDEICFPNGDCVDPDDSGNVCCT